VTAEGDDLYYEVRGQEQPLLMIAPGGGDGWQYSFAADILADEYKVITYDRRANSRSTMNDPQNIEISQQSRDAVAVLRAVGETSLFVFGNSSGAVIALDMAKPQAVRAVVAHEAPMRLAQGLVFSCPRRCAALIDRCERRGSDWNAGLGGSACENLGSPALEPIQQAPHYPQRRVGVCRSARDVPGAHQEARLVVIKIRRRR
jgi:pimeloyl-ACP methyl ester carboxylesterase